MKTVIHINQFKIKRNIKATIKEPPITVRTYKETKYASKVEVKDKEGNIVVTIHYRPEKPLDCGARVWLETNQLVEIQ